MLNKIKDYSKHLKALLNIEAYKQQSIILMNGTRDHLKEKHNNVTSQMIDSFHDKYSNDIASLFDEYKKKFELNYDDKISEDEMKFIKEKFRSQVNDLLGDKNDTLRIFGCIDCDF